ncbi:ABC transporter permease [Myceligenerans pegani]|uniref:ABC transporter permease subunit n=1 Tax=Myceligenerans pegani TaxID=2776917 RepID=A0ABR9N391_9MICO|nr:ABC transporter permease subunit [Myceligenerans sp. TRM 65318]MBE1878115.1 ABC transporter permease subunit [Myceligenerans sp. TRM 65318]MBE3020386.1 ABC transporter permease subunit [Myceligenerans sp. TRM 65318]
MTIGEPRTAPRTGPADAAVPDARRRVPLIRLLRAEVRWIFRRPRTLVVLALLAVLPVITGVAVDLTLDGPVTSAETGPGPGPGGGPPIFVTMATSAFVLPLGSLMTLLMMLLPLTVAMASGDALAGEQSHGALRGWLLAPVSRGRLLAVKAAGVLVVAFVAALLVVVSGLATGLVLAGTDRLVSMSGTELSVADVLWRLAVAVAWATVYLMAVGAVALAISASTEHPMLVVVSVLGGLIVFGVLMQFSALDWLHPYLLPTSVTGLVDLIRDPVPFDALAEGTIRALSYLVIGLSLAYARLTTRDG